MTKASPNLQKKIKELMNFSYRAATDLSKCKSCGTCVKFCPLKIREFNSVRKAITIKTDKTCKGCSVCYKRCPEKAISLIFITKNK